MPDHSVLVSDPTGAPNVSEVDKSLNEVSSPNDTDLVGRRRTVEQKEVKRDYSNVKQVVVDHYRNLRSKQTHAHVLKMHEKFKTRERRPLKIWEALEIMSTIVDTSDPDISLPNLEHLYQTAEGLREEGAERQRGAEKGKGKQRKARESRERQGPPPNSSSTQGYTRPHQLLKQRLTPASVDAGWKRHERCPPPERHIVESFLEKRCPARNTHIFYKKNTIGILSFFSLKNIK